MASNFDFNLLNELLEDAPIAGYGPNTVFGKCTLTIEVAYWTGERGARKFNTRPFENGTTVDKKKGEYLQLTFHVDVPELNSALQNEWKRRVDVKQSNKTNKDESKWVLTDWSETVMPSLVSVIGKDFSQKLVTKGVYVELEEAQTVEKNKDGELKGFDVEKDGTTVHYTNSVPRFIRSFKSKAECQAAREERYAKKDNAAEETTGDIPANVVNDVKQLVATLGADAAYTVLDENQPFGTQYTAEELFTAAGIDTPVDEE